MVDSFEKIPCAIFPDLHAGSVQAARQIAQLIRDKASRNEKCVLGLATGSTPKTMYAELVRLHNEEGLSFKNVITFNLDEYYPIDKDALQSYHYFMNRMLFQHVDIDPQNIFIPDGELPKEKIKDHCAAYEQRIEEAGGIDLQILGIGNNGHIGFNEPGSSIYRDEQGNVVEPAIGEHDAGVGDESPFQVPGEDAALKGEVEDRSDDEPVEVSETRETIAVAEAPVVDEPEEDEAAAPAPKRARRSRAKAGEAKEAKPEAKEKAAKPAKEPKAPKAKGATAAARKRGGKKAGAVVEDAPRTGTSDKHAVDDAAELPDVSQFLTQPTSPADLDVLPEYDDDE